MVEMLAESNVLLEQNQFDAPIAQLSSEAAANLSRWGKQGFWIATATSAAFLVFGSAYGYCNIDKTISQRIMMFILLGLLPSLVIFLAGCAAYWSLKAASLVYDPIAAVVRVVYRLVEGRFLRLAFPVMLGAKKLLRWCGRRMVEARGVCRWTTVMAGVLTLNCVAGAGAGAKSIGAASLRAAGHFIELSCAVAVAAAFPVRVAARSLIKVLPSHA